MSPQAIHSKKDAARFDSSKFNTELGLEGSEHDAFVKIHEQLMHAASLEESICSGDSKEPVLSLFDPHFYSQSIQEDQDKVPSQMKKLEETQRRRLKIREAMRKMNARRAIKPKVMNTSVDFNSLMMKSQAITEMQKHPNALMRRSYGGHETK